MPGIGRCGCEGGEQLIELDRRFFVFGDESVLVEGLVDEPLAVVVGSFVHGGAVSEEP